MSNRYVKYMHPLGQVQAGLLMGLDIAIRREHSDRYSETEQFGAITIENFVEGRPNSHKGAPDSVPATVCACYCVCLLPCVPAAEHQRAQIRCSRA